MRTTRLFVGSAVLTVALMALGGWFLLQRPQSATARAPQEAQMQASDADTLRELAERLLGAGSGVIVTLRALGGRGAPPPAPRTRILVGQLPERLSVEVPFPSDARLLGSVTTDPAERFPSGTLPAGSFDASQAVIALDVPASTDVYAFYDDAMAARGWVLPRSASLLGIGGFVDAERAELDARLAHAPASQGMYCFRPTREQPQGASLEVKVYMGRNGMLDVRLSLGTGVRSLCFVPEPDPTLLLPPLVLPDEIKQIQSMVVPTTRANTVTSEATIASSMAPAELAEHFGAQLRAAGWTQVQAGGDDRLAWSVWQESGGAERRGFLTVVAVPGEDLRSLNFVVPGQAGAR